ncbi:hypothetical protein B5C34_00640 [Pacificimonas flava]|uniref:Lipopolysaccharide assembly protein A domain-containing protein n=2 Tax=Pacificimonas TaxID=1960290 RepID=A0A219B1V4_9SPHN|nr:MULTISPECIES: LapA family protein [Pacificimonas]MBZ6378281.1 LapA family protein [Pacificimonas aurantium]OWV32103.1 hypothetical protein B5C34_00640 [Pacificimonas flava]
MRFLTLLLYIFFGLLVVWFASQNWDRTVLWLPGGYEAFWPLGVYILVALLIGLLPMTLLHSVTRWRLKRKIRKLERRLELETSGPGAPAPAHAPASSAATPRPEGEPATRPASPSL